MIGELQVDQAGGVGVQYRVSKYSGFCIAQGMTSTSIYSTSSVPPPDVTESVAAVL